MEMMDAIINELAGKNVTLANTGGNKQDVHSTLCGIIVQPPKILVAHGIEFVYSEIADDTVSHITSRRVPSQYSVSPTQNNGLLRFKGCPKLWRGRDSSYSIIWAT